ncbi:MAG: carbon-nitrogen hydrolase family protein [Gemmatimonadota bacterium]|uniref:CN hydrolase domain-containing protein n=1 Tax=marine metagenome TaxID=408172 RepID=A0A381W5H4_9ZZZZ|nr:carbon-nitrogen hydrolase family protein [Gemmatimonadota bacterium]
MDEHLSVALITDVFHEDVDGSRLEARLAHARAGGASMAVLPELPLNPWSPATRVPRDEDTEPPKGSRQQIMAEAAAKVGVALLGGVIVTDPDTGQRHNTAILYDNRGQELGWYRKVHLPEEEGYWETSHYVPGREPPKVIPAPGITVGIQICSDINRPHGSQLLRSQGAEVLLVPRATPSETYERWRLVLRANALMADTYLLSVNRPGPEFDVDIGGPSLAVAPDGEVLYEGTDPVAIVELEAYRAGQAVEEYPGYLARPAGLYARGWTSLDGDG